MQFGPKRHHANDCPSKDSQRAADPAGIGPYVTCALCDWRIPVFQPGSNLPTSEMTAHSGVVTGFSQLPLVNMHQDIQRLRETLRIIADFAVGNGDVCELIARRARAALSATPETAEDVAGWIVASDTGLLFRTMKSGEITWTDNRDEAIRFARRKDAEMFAAEDEDAWHIIPWETR